MQMSRDIRIKNFGAYYIDLREISDKKTPIIDILIFEFKILF
jgi:hypothetical protein